MGRRHGIDIIADILRVIKNGNGKKKKTQIMYEANLSYTQLDGNQKKGIRGYLPFCEKKGLVRRKRDDNGSFVYENTDKGKEFLKIYRGINDLIA